MNFRASVPLMLSASLLLVAAGCAAPPPRPMPPPMERHPAYLHALTALREARWLIEHRNGEGVANGDEHVAVDEIGAAIHEIRQAAFDDGKDANYAPPADVAALGPARLHQAANILFKVHGELTAEEDNGFAEGLRDRAIQHVDIALHATQAAIHALQGG